MFEIAQLRELIQASERRMTRAAVGMAAACFPLLFGTILLEQWAKANRPNLLWISYVGWAVLLVTFIAFLVAIVRNIEPTRCPQCGGALERFHLHIMIASGNCPLCGDTVVIKPSNPGVERPDDD